MTINNENILHLNLKSKWFDMILSGEKKEEYREIKDFWVKRFISDILVHNRLFTNDIKAICKNGGSFQLSNVENPNEKIKFKNYKTIIFSNGYSKNRRQFMIELLSIKIDFGKSELGANPNQKYFVLKLGEIIKL